MAIDSIIVFTIFDKKQIWYSICCGICDYVFNLCVFGNTKYVNHATDSTSTIPKATDISEGQQIGATQVEMHDLPVIPDPTSKSNHLPSISNHNSASLPTPINYTR